MRYEKALLVDDWVPITMAISRRLRIDLGIHSDAATSSEDAISLARENRYDLCICDGLDGGWVEVHDYFASESPDTRFILYSGKKEYLDEADSCGIEKYGKPIESEKMIASLKE